MWTLWMFVLNCLEWGATELLVEHFLYNLLAPFHNATLHHGHLVTNGPLQWWPPARDAPASKTAESTKLHRKKYPHHKILVCLLRLAKAKQLLSRYKILCTIRIQNKFLVQNDMQQPGSHI
jgi:hypothetical protein